MFRLPTVIGLAALLLIAAAPPPATQPSARCVNPPWPAKATCPPVKGPPVAAKPPPRNPACPNSTTPWCP